MKDIPNQRQKDTIKNMVENGGKMGKAMKDAGYSDAYAHNPKKLKKTKSWKKLLRTIPNEKIIKVAMEGLDATMVKTSLTEPDRELPDYAVRRMYLETVLKMKGKLEENHNINHKGHIDLRSRFGVYEYPIEGNESKIE